MWWLGTDEKPKSKRKRMDVKMSKVYVLMMEEIDASEQYQGEPYGSVVCASLDKKKVESEFEKIVEEKINELELDDEQLEELREEEYYEFDDFGYIDMASKNLVNIYTETTTYSLWIEEKELI